MSRRLTLAAVGSDLAEVETDQVGLRVAGGERPREVDLGLGGLVDPMGPRGMWMGLIAGLLVAAVLLCTRFLRSSRQVPTMPPSTVTDGG